MDERPIGVFDSGVGGLTAVRELQALLPRERLVYFGDTGRVPYGSRSPETILQYARQDIRFLLSKNVKFLLAACGTISSVLPPAYAATLPVPYAGVLDAAARAAAQATRTGRIGVIGTAATIRSGSYAQRLRVLLPGVQVVARSCPMFVPLVENGYVEPGDAVTTTIAREYLAPVRAAHVDTLILGCTHYPLIAHIIGQVMGPDVTLIDPGRETALVASRSLAQAGLLAPSGAAGGTDYYVSDLPEGFEASLKLFIGPQGAGPVERVAIESF